MLRLLTPRLRRKLCTLSIPPNNRRWGILTITIVRKLNPTHDQMDLQNNNMVSAINPILFGLENKEILHKTDELSSPRPTQPKKKSLKTAEIVLL